MQGHSTQECRHHNSRKEEYYAPETDKSVKETDGYQKARIHQHVHKFQKGRAKIISSGKVLGDPGTWKVVGTSKAKQLVENPTHTTNSFAALEVDPQSNHASTSDQEHTSCQRETIKRQSEHVETSKGWVLRTFGRQETPTQREDVSKQTQEEIVTILLDKDEKEIEGEVVRQEVHTRCATTYVDTSTATSVALCTTVKSAEETEDNSTALIALPLREVDAIPITMVSPAKQISSQQSKRYGLIEDEQEGGVEVVDTRSMVECLGVVLLDENQGVQVESPNRVLHYCFSQYRCKSQW
ncbi:hypothetical protein R3W88_031978 [Solanum pinnatisectum]|uniref:Uncharacterized protein n=1 Tax=Solanum pinnatisectum TaxID=50273 RepID=A0AAV9LMW7_9SOLN|nr:hypothetical protein R3W88_031978 [Solanum pinnatisectum]